MPVSDPRAGATATIANGQTTSAAVDARGFNRAAVLLPATFTGTALTFLVSADGTTYKALYDITGAQVSVTVAQDRAYDLPEELGPWPYFKFVSGSAEGGARSLAVALSE